MQKIVEFKKRGFFSHGIDVDALNERIYHLNQEGWKVISINTATAFQGQITAYILLIENDEL
ncbi:hypothetical protein [Pseudoalteromonas arctica]|uniref:hypothetical protein n=1 Tax=Pseudoalteromonas arctica TaxID=394751 RepID=UPI002493FF10|nr:hypothetical protein [Pseudoalteromonas arctica]